MEKIVMRDIRITHMAGIVPVAGLPLDFNMPWSDALMPVAPDYTAIERAVYECVLAGCTTIWIVCHMGTQPLLRKRLGDTILYPEENVVINLDLADRANIFYVPIHPKDRDKRDCLAWSLLWGANSAYRLCKFISKWTIPERFYCAFPYGVNDDKFIIKNRPLFMNSKNQILLSHEGKTVCDGIHCSFTFDADDYKKCRTYIRQYPFKNWDPEVSSKPIQQQQLSLSLEQVFKNLDTDGRLMLECPWFYDISSWENYRKFLASDINLTKNKKSFSRKKSREVLHNAISRRRAENAEYLEKCEEGK